MTDTEIRRGLDGVVADETAISKVMAETNSLTYRGYAVQDLCEHSNFEETAYLLLKGELPNAAELEAFTKQERSEREISDDLVTVISKFPKDAHPMDTVRTGVSFLGMEDADCWNNEPDALLEKSIRLLARIPTIIATDYRFRKGLDRIAPRADLPFADNFFHMCFGEVPDAATLKCFDISMILYAEHSFNASTFTARTIASSLSEIYASVTGAIGSLKGPLHGGANEAVMHMLLEIEEADKAEAWMRDALATKKKVMGFGHRVYKNGDSRVPTMHQAFVDMAEHKGETKWVDIEAVLSKIMIEEKGIHPNLDYPAGPSYYLMGFDIDMFTPIFVMSRITGWAAHVMEQLAANRLVRPLSAYNGVAQRPVTPIDQR
ncbi:MAG: bifunctional 2-methylcitrate synthase/citrate synthase [Alphaproteobacteria bacterium]|nr:bifunctional 2-methylcitrate synthase/citrate synthase [Alphaproteobacteria bacterium SS10]